MTFNPYKRTADLNLFKSIGLILNLCKSPYGSYNVHQMDDNEANMFSDATLSNNYESKYGHTGQEVLTRAMQCAV